MRRFTVNAGYVHAFAGEKLCQSIQPSFAITLTFKKLHLKLQSFVSRLAAMKPAASHQTQRRSKQWHTVLFFIHK